MKLQLAVLVFLGLALQLSLPICADVTPGRHLLRTPDRYRKMLLRDQYKLKAMNSKISGDSDLAFSNSTGNNSQLAVSLPGSFNDTPAYLARISLGTPPREFWGTADTGSEVVWVQCEPCVECLPVPSFQTNLSTSFESIACSDTSCATYNGTFGSYTSCSSAGACHYGLQYAEGESAGSLASDTLTLDSQAGNPVTFPNFVFGCSDNNSDTPDPIFGLSPGPLSLISQLKSTVGSAFSICFPSWEDDKITALTLGSSARIENLTYTPLLSTSLYSTIPQGQLYHYANLTGISVDGKRVEILSDALILDQATGIGGTILDTGYSYPQAARRAYYPLRWAIDSNVEYTKVENSTGLYDLDLCYDVTDLNVTSVDQVPLPTITFHFQDLDLQLPTANSYEPAFDDNGTVVAACFVMQPNPGLLSAEFGPGIIFGNYFMQNHYLYFDLQTSQIGIAPSDC